MLYRIPKWTKLDDTQNNCQTDLHIKQLSNFFYLSTPIPDPGSAPATCVSIHGQLLAIGGKDSDKEPTTAINMYDRTAI